MIEVEKKVEDSEVSKSSSASKGRRQLTKKVIVYCYGPEMEETYRSSMLKAFKMTLDEGNFTFVIGMKLLSIIIHVANYISIVTSCRWYFPLWLSLQYYIIAFEFPWSAKSFHVFFLSHLKSCKSLVTAVMRHQKILFSGSAIRNFWFSVGCFFDSVVFCFQNWRIVPTFVGTSWHFVKYSDTLAVLAKYSGYVPRDAFNFTDGRCCVSGNWLVYCWYSWPFLVDDRNLRVADFSQFWATAKVNSQSLMCRLQDFYAYGFFFFFGFKPKRVPTLKENSVSVRC